MAERYDWIAIGPYGVYALMDAECSAEEFAEFRDEALSKGHRVDIVPVREACDRHLAFLSRMKDVSAALRPTPTQSPTDPASPLSRGEERR